ncbi:MAG: O-antigen ligase family protein [Elusimicrobia bacterium]|nr:O-antigen ligase family protein [Elusimicrobiota bacterium]
MSETFKPTKFSQINIILAGILLFLIPVIPDEKITRWKLWVLESGVLSVILIWLISEVHSGNIHLKISPLNKSVFSWLFFISILYFTSKNSHVAELELFRIIVCFLSFFLFSNIISNSTYRERLINFWLYGGILSVIYGIMTHYGGFWIIRTPQADRIFSTFGNPIFFAAFLVATMPFLIYKMVLANHWKNKIIWLSCLIAFSIALYFTKSRAAWIAFGITILALIFFILKSKRQKIFLILFFIIVGNAFVYKTKNIWMRQQAHLLIWRDSLKMLSANPVFGVGIGSFHINFPSYASDELKAIWPQNQNIINDAHSEFVQILAETGLVGFGIFLWVIFTFFSQTQKFIKQSKNRNDFMLQAAGLAAVCGILIQNMFSVDMRFTITSFYLFSIFGILSSFSAYKDVNVGKNQRYFLIILAAIVVFFLEYQMVIKQYRSWKIVFKSEDFLDKRIVNSETQKGEILKLIASNPADARLYFKLGYIWANEIKVNKSAIPKAIESFLRATQIDPYVENGGAFNNLGNIYFTLGDRSKAKENYIKAINVNPKLIDAHINLGIVYYYEGRLKESTIEFENVLAIDSKNSSAIFMLKKMRE